MMIIMIIMMRMAMMIIKWWRMRKMIRVVRKCLYKQEEGIPLTI